MADEVWRRMLVTDRRLYGGSAGLPERVARAAARHGATAVVLREKDLPGDALRELARRLLETSPVPVIVAHDPEAAREVGAAGVHLGWTSPAPLPVRDLLGQEALVGVSVHTPQELSALEEMRGSVDYVLLGPVFPTPSKEGILPPLGLERGAAMARSSSLPVVAVGGVDLSREGELLDAGFSGVAAIRAFAPAEDSCP